MTTKLTPEYLKETLIPALTKALQIVGEEHDITITLGAGSYNRAGKSFKITVLGVMKGENGEEQDIFALNFERYACRYGLTPKQIGAKFTQGGKVFTIIGLNPKAHFYPILGKATNSFGNVYKFSATDVIRGLIV